MTRHSLPGVHREERFDPNAGTLKRRHHLEVDVVLKDQEVAVLNARHLLESWLAEHGDKFEAQVIEVTE